MCLISRVEDDELHKEVILGLRDKANTLRIQLVISRTVLRWVGFKSDFVCRLINYSERIYNSRVSKKVELNLMRNSTNSWKIKGTWFNRKIHAIHVTRRVIAVSQSGSSRFCYLVRKCCSMIRVYYRGRVSVLGGVCRKYNRMFQEVWRYDGF